MKHTKIIKLAIHPIVEDVISANLDDLESRIEIGISIVGERDTIQVTITGNAVEYFLSQLKQREVNIRGINSVDERLRLYYGDAFGVILDDKSEKIKVIMPVYKDNGSEGKKQYG